MKYTHLYSLGVALLCLLVLDYSTAWTAPSGNPPANNVTAPLNTSSVAQVKNGPLSVDDLAVFGDGIFDDDSPTIEFSDATVGQTDWYIHVNGNRMYFINDRDDNGSWTGENPWPLYLDAPANLSKFTGTVHADEFCNYAGDSCLDANNLADLDSLATAPAATGGPTYFGSTGESPALVWSSSIANTWVEVTYPANVPATAKQVILRSRQAIEDSRTISTVIRGYKLPDVTIQTTRSHNSSSDSSDSTTFFYVPYAASRTFDLRMGAGAADDVKDDTRVDFVGYVE